VDTFWIFLASLAAAVAAFEAATALQRATSTFGSNAHSRLDGVVANEEQHSDNVPSRSVLASLLIVFFPTRFDVNQAKNKDDVTTMLRRAGYPYESVGAFYAASMQIFTRYLIIGGGLSAAVAFLGMPLLAVPVMAVFVFLGLRKPYSTLRIAAKKRAEATRNNMLIGLSVLQSLLDAGVGVQEALRRTANVGGPFCNLLGLLVARINVDDFDKAIETTRQHIPDPKDVEVVLFFRDIEDYFRNNRPLAKSVEALRVAVHRSVVEATESKAALVKQRSGLFGIIAVLGLILAILAPFAGAF